MRLDSILEKYASENYVLRQKAKFLSVFSIVVVLILLIAIPSTGFITGLQPGVIIPEVFCFCVVLYSVWMLWKGRFRLAGHTIFSVSFLTIWVVILLDPSTAIIRLNTVSFVIGMLSAMPLIVTESKKPMWVYFLLNSLVLIAISFYLYNRNVISWLEMFDYLQDNLIIFTFVFIVAYNLFNINHKALMHTQQELEERKKAEVSFQHVRVLLDNIINSMPSGLIGVDNAGHVIQWNQEAQRLTGISGEDANGSPLDKVFPQLKESMEQIKKVIASRETVKNSRVKIQLDDEEKIANITIYPLITNGTDGAVIRVDDVTERVRMEEIMIQSEKMMAVGGLAAGMAHEINNPLAGMLQNAQVIENRLTQEIPANKQAADKHEIRIEALKAYMEERHILEMLSAIKLSGERAARIIDNMLKFSRRSGSGFNPVRLNSLIDRTIELAANDYDLKDSFDFKKIKIVCEYDKSLPEVPCKEIRLQQVLLNLLKNAAQAIAETENNSKAQINIRTYTKNAQAYIEIEDNGPGMTEEISRHVFEPFYTTKLSQKGTGLGLSISYFIITEDHNGILQVDSQEGHGTKFTIQLPLERVES